MKGLLNSRNFFYSKTWIFITGLGATLWFLIRVIPKPARARYPCMQAAFPLMSSFVIWLMAVAATVFSIRKFKQALYSSGYLSAAIFLGAAIISFSVFLINQHQVAIANVIHSAGDEFPVPSNNPIGEAKGLFPGRVVWVHDERATNENYVPQRNSTDFWYSNANADEGAISEMLSLSIRQYTGIDDIAAAWDALFRAFNKTAGKGDRGYLPGEKIAFKINLTNQSCTDAERPMRMDAAPQLLNAVLYELVNNAGVAEPDITMGDPYRKFRKEYIELVTEKFPDVNYVDGEGGGQIHKTLPSAGEELVFSDKRYKSTLPQHFVDADYVINIPCLKSHNEGGITLISKNHQGIYLEKGSAPETQSAMKMHYSLPANSPGAGKYRHTVDYMGHRDTGGKGLLYIVDAIWGGESWQGWIKKFKSGPFNDDYPNSILISQDPVALESVCYDILFQEYLTDNTKANYPLRFKYEIADYLAQCASNEYWPEDIDYDPEGDGTPLESLGVFEHWNNAAERKYSRNLGTGQGIELNYFKSGTTGTPKRSNSSVLVAAPNPFKGYTRFTLQKQVSGNATVSIYDYNGRLIKTLDFMNSNSVIWEGTDMNSQPVPPGLYMFILVEDSRPSGLNGKILLIR